MYPNSNGVMKNRNKKRRNNHTGNTKTYMIRLLAYVHRLGQGESFTNKGEYKGGTKSTLTKPKAQIHPKNS